MLKLISCHIVYNVSNTSISKIQLKIIKWSQKIRRPFNNFFLADFCRCFASKIVFNHTGIEYIVVNNTIYVWKENRNR